MSVRGWIPLLFWGATTDTAPASVRTFYEIRADDGWGRPYRLAARSLPRGEPWASDPRWQRTSGGVSRPRCFGPPPPTWTTAADGCASRSPPRAATATSPLPTTSLSVSYLPVGLTLRLTREPGQVQRQIEDAFVRGRHYFRVAGNRFDLIDARLLAEFRLEYLP